MKTVVILGSGRSGSSLVANMLIKLGVHMGTDFLGPGPSNPLGHFENLRFLNLNERVLLPIAGGGWMKPPNSEGLKKAEKLFSNKIKTLVKREQREPIWGWKDPRTSLLIDLYYPYLVDPYFIVCERNPDDVARSWSKISSMSFDESKELCLKYDNLAGEFLDENPSAKHLHVLFEDVIANPVDFIERVSGFLGLSPSSNQKRSARFCVLPKSILRDISKYIEECDKNEL